MPGQPLAITYPVLGDPIAAALNQLVASIQTIQADLEPKIIPSEFDWITNISAQGHALTNLSKLHLEAQSSTSGHATGDQFFFGGNFYVQTSGGLVQMTSGGVLNAAGLGGIVGDYGGSNPARVTYVDASSWYVFTDDTNDWSSIQVDDVLLRSTGAFVTLGTQAVGTATWNFGANPASGTAFVTMDSSGNIGATDSITHAITTSGKVTLTGAADLAHPDRTLTVPAVLHNNEFGVCTNDIVAAAGVVCGTGPARFRSQLHGLWVGHQLKSVTARLIKTTGGTASLTVYKSSTAAITPAAVSPTVNSTTLGAAPITATLTVADVVSANEFFSVAVNLPAAGDIVVGYELVFDRP